MWTVNCLMKLHHLCGLYWKILHFRPNTEHHIFWRITTTFRTFLETSFTKCKQTRQHYVRCHPCCLQLSLFLTKQQQSTGNSKLFIKLNFARSNFLLFSNRSTTVYPSNRKVWLMSDIINCVGDVKQEHCTICYPDTVANTPTQTDKQHNIYSTWSEHQFHTQFSPPFLLSAKHKHQYRFVWPSCFKLYFIKVTWNLHILHFVTSDNKRRKTNFPCHTLPNYKTAQQLTNDARNSLVRR